MDGEELGLSARATPEMSRTYQEAIRLLRSRSARLRTIDFGPGGEPLPWRGNVVGMRKWLAELGHDESKRPLDVIHVTGTKGKGSTCAWTDALLRSHFRSARAPDDRPRKKVGLYTSPSIMSECERIRVDFAPVSEDVFARHFFHVWDTIKRHVGGSPDDMPGYLQLLALLSAHIFRNEGVSVAIYEVHAGGRFDSTNIWDNPAACGFNTIGLDHVPLLGRNISEIAWNKAGIMKKGTPAFSVPQVPEAEEQIVAEARLLGCPLVFVDGEIERREILDGAAQLRPELRLPAPRGNLALAMRLADAYLESRCDGAKLTDQDVMGAVRSFRWPGRFQTVEAPGARTTWYLDFAHNDLSLPVALDWFAAEVSKFCHAGDAERGGEQQQQQQQQRTNVLVFGHESSTRETAGMVEVMTRHCRETGLRFDRVVLASHSRRLSDRRVFDYEKALQVMDLWKGMDGSPETVWAATIAEAMAMVERWAAAPGTGGAHALVVGSSHLVSSAVAAMPNYSPG